ncbi:MAG TPA: MarR family transcriptional regulator [Jatrophihabitans sp.]|nr:MarR family transcriptional regulator [Jatrophihabitans sp.]
MAQLSQRATVDDVDEDLTARVEIAARGLLALSTRASMDLPQGISLTQLRALAAAEEAGPCSLGVLAEAMMISTSSASRLVDRLIAAGVLDRRPSEVSRREVILQVTPRGRRLLRRHEASRRAVFAELLQRMTDAEVRALIRGLEAVKHHVEDGLI